MSRVMTHRNFNSNRPNRGKAAGGIALRTGGIALMTDGNALRTADGVLLMTDGVLLRTDGIALRTGGIALRTGKTKTGPWGQGMDPKGDYNVL